MPLGTKLLQIQDIFVIDIQRGGRLTAAQEVTVYFLYSTESVV